MEMEAEKVSFVKGLCDSDTDGSFPLEGHTEARILP